MTVVLLKVGARTLKKKKKKNETSEQMSLEEKMEIEQQVLLHI